MQSVSAALRQKRLERKQQQDLIQRARTELERRKRQRLEQQEDECTAEYASVIESTPTADSASDSISHAQAVVTEGVETEANDPCLSSIHEKDITTNTDYRDVKESVSGEDEAVSVAKASATVSQHPALDVIEEYEIVEPDMSLLMPIIPSTEDTKPSSFGHSSYVVGEDEVGPGTTNVEDSQGFVWNLEEENVDEEKVYQTMDTAYFSRLKHQAEELERIEAREKERKQMKEVELVKGELPYGFFDNPEEDAHARGVEAPSVRKERQFEHDLKIFEETVQLARSQEEAMRLRSEALRYEEEFVDSLVDHAEYAHRIDAIRLQRDRRSAMKDLQAATKHEPVAQWKVKTEPLDSCTEDEVNVVIDWRNKGKKRPS